MAEKDRKAQDKPTQEPPRTQESESHMPSEPLDELPTFDDVKEADAKGILSRLSGLTGGLTASAFKLAAKTGSVGRSFFNPDQQRRMMEAGLYLRDLREVAGLTLSELSDALDLEDKSMLEAVENGTATLSFDLILRISALLARHDPVPAILNFTRTYNPRLWGLLDNWGASKLPLQFERERRFVNIFRRHDAARKLSNEEFDKVLDFTRAAFDMALQFVAGVELEREAKRAEEGEEGEGGDKKKKRRKGRKYRKPAKAEETETHKDDDST